MPCTALQGLSHLSHDHPQPVLAVEQQGHCHLLQHSPQQQLQGLAVLVVEADQAIVGLLGHREQGWGGLPPQVPLAPQDAVASSVRQCGEQLKVLALHDSQQLPQACWMGRSTSTHSFQARISPPVTCRLLPHRMQRPSMETERQ